MKRAAPNFSKRPSCCVVNQATLYRKKRKKATTKLLHSIIPSAFHLMTFQYCLTGKWSHMLYQSEVHRTTPPPSYAKFENEFS